MNTLLGLGLAIGQYGCNIAAIFLFVYMLRQPDNSPTSMNVWLGPLVLIGLGAVFKLARKGAGGGNVKL